MKPSIPWENLHYDCCNYSVRGKINVLNMRKGYRVRQWDWGLPQQWPIWDVTPYSLLHIYQRFRVTCYLYLQSTRLSGGKDCQGRHGLGLEANHELFIFCYSRWFVRNLSPCFPLAFITVRFPISVKFPHKQQYVIQVTGSDTRIISLSFSQHPWKGFLRCVFCLGP
jgi:hypothetical protein